METMRHLNHYTSSLVQCQPAGCEPGRAEGIADAEKAEKGASYLSSEGASHLPRLLGRVARNPGLDDADGQKKVPATFPAKVPATFSGKVPATEERDALADL